MSRADRRDASERATPGAPVIDASGLAKTYKRGPEEVHALNGVSFRLDAGEVVALVGRSGSGKTTLLNVLAGWEEPDTGRIVWRGRELARPALLPWSDLALVPQSLGLIDELSVRENIELPGRLSRRRSRDRSAHDGPSRPVTSQDDPGRPLTSQGLGGVRPNDATGAFPLQDHPQDLSPGAPDAEELLDSLGLRDFADRTPDQISIGEQQRTALARALVVSPRLLLADEPSGHQDAVWAAGVFEALRRAAARGSACLVATHNHEFLDYVDRTLSIANGVLETPH